MIFNSSIKQHNQQKKSTNNNLHKLLTAKQYIKLTKQELRNFVDNHEIVNCVQYLNNQIKGKNKSVGKLLRLYFILFQIAAVFGEKQIVVNFLKQYQFTNLWNVHKNCLDSKSQVLLAQKICKFLDSFKEGYKLQLHVNALVKQYHQFRLLSNPNNSSFFTQTCKVIKQYIQHSMNMLIKQLQFSDWASLNDEGFKQFYQQYGDLCTIFKRVCYIRSSFISEQNYQIPIQIRAQVQERFIKMQENQKRKNSEAKIQQKSTVVQHSALNAKRKLKAINHLISKMQQNI